MGCAEPVAGAAPAGEKKPCARLPRMGAGMGSQRDSLGDHGDFVYEHPFVTMERHIKVPVLSPI